ncbi:MAG TPA: hypothetical protein DCO70_08530 [Verrucomicrobiales bacterium]|nr:hypothetical protein [Verrucomicrobiales bacterium]|tara:strand:+ start:1053 stop:1463 length:411 start_codon:yes stop_codon:yes gene_type:complete
MSSNGSAFLKNAGIVAGAMIALGLLGWSWKANMMQAPVQIGYYCLSCKKSDHISTYQANWRQYPGAMSDSVLRCVHCNKGPAHPTNKCDSCGTVYILHLFTKYDEFGSPVCPECDDAYGQEAKSKGFDLIPKAINP